eukprot:scaffold2207_cov70-Phaeocystis_antarctica.AAC.2
MSSLNLTNGLSVLIRSGSERFSRCHCSFTANFSCAFSPVHPLHSSAGKTNFASMYRIWSSNESPKPSRPIALTKSRVQKSSRGCLTPPWACLRPRRPAAASVAAVRAAACCASAAAAPQSAAGRAPPRAAAPAPGIHSVAAWLLTVALLLHTSSSLARTSSGPSCSCASLRSAVRRSTALP